MTNSILVTGASTGLGLETSLFLAQKGFTVYGTVLHEQDRNEIELPAKKRNLKIRVLQLDITDPEGVDTAVKKVVEETGGIYGLVNNAGTRLRGCFEDLSDREVRRLFNTNVFGTMAVTRTVLPYMRSAGCGRIIMITSVAGMLGAFGSSSYCATKFAQEGFGESLLQEVERFGVKVIRIAPGIINTEAWNQNRVVATGANNSGSPYYEMFFRSESLADKLVQTSPTTPAEVAKVVYKALSAKRPRYRYTVGKRASLFFALRRYFPGELFEKLYFSMVRRQLLNGR